MEKQIVIKKLIKARKKILDLIRPLSKQLWEEVFLGTWSLKDLVAHLIGWDIWGLRATKEILQGKLPSYYQYYDEDWKSFNDKLVNKYKKGNKNDLLVSIKNSHKKLVEELERIPDKLYNKNFNLTWKGFKVTLTSDTLTQSDDEEIHTKQIKDWLKNQRTEDILDLAGKFRIKNKKSLLKARESMEKHYKRF